jgi:hypothetical protein
VRAVRVAADGRTGAARTLRSSRTLTHDLVIDRDRHAYLTFAVAAQLAFQTLRGPTMFLASAAPGRPFDRGVRLGVADEEFGIPGVDRDGSALVARAAAGAVHVSRAAAGALAEIAALARAVAP